jgi:hypothetical protein
MLCSDVSSLAMSHEVDAIGARIRNYIPFRFFTIQPFSLFKSHRRKNMLLSGNKAIATNSSDEDRGAAYIGSSSGSSQSNSQTTSAWGTIEGRVRWLSCDGDM